MADPALPKPKDFDCPDCHAPAGSACRSSRGKALSTPHTRRLYKAQDAWLNINTARSRSSAKTLNKYLQLANHAARWAHSGHAQPALRPYLKRVPKDGDRGFWLGEVLNDLIRAAESDLTPTEMKRLHQVIDLIIAKPPR